MGNSLNAVENINDDVVYYVDQALQSISQCSKAFVLIEAAYNIFYAVPPPTSWKDLLKAAIENGTSVTKWIDALRGRLQYKVCVETAALNWRSAVTGALMGI
jgi:hypothetical protein